MINAYADITLMITAEWVLKDVKEFNTILQICISLLIAK